MGKRGHASIRYCDWFRPRQAPFALLLRHPQPQEDICLSWGETVEQCRNSYCACTRKNAGIPGAVKGKSVKGVVVSENGRDWTLTGQGPVNAMFGPYFGNSEQEFMVVSDKAFFITRDGGKTWKEAAPAFVPPDALRKSISPIGAFNYFGWDATNNILYASSLGASVYRLKLQP